MIDTLIENDASSDDTVRVFFYFIFLRFLCAHLPSLQSADNTRRTRTRTFARKNRRGLTIKRESASFLSLLLVVVVFEDGFASNTSSSFPNGLGKISSSRHGRGMSSPRKRERNERKIPLARVKSGPKLPRGQNFTKCNFEI